MVKKKIQIKSKDIEPEDDVEDLDPEQLLPSSAKKPPQSSTTKPSSPKKNIKKLLIEEEADENYDGELIEGLRHG